MHILSNRYREKYYEAKCSSCDSILQLNETENDCIGALICPCCNKGGMIELIDKKNKTNENLVKDLNHYDRCDNCGSQYGFTYDDILCHGQYGLAVVKCPYCGSDTLTEDNFVLTADNYSFPENFSHTLAIENGGDAVNVFDELGENGIVGYINRGIKYLREHKHCRDWGGHITGNILVYIHKFEGDECYEVTCSKDFYTTNFSFTDEDYVHERDKPIVIENIREQCKEDEKSLCDEYLYENIK